MRAASCLILERDRRLANRLCRQLRELGCGIAATAATAEEGVSAAARMRPTLVLADVRLQGNADGEFDGVAAVERIRDRFPGPVIYVTGPVSEELLLRAGPTRPLGYLNKPVRKQDMRTMLAVALDSLDAAETYRGSIAGMLEQALDHLSVGVVLINRQLQVRFSNRAGREVIERRKLLGREKASKGLSFLPQAREKIDRMVRQRRGGNIVLDCANGPPLQIHVFILDRGTAPDLDELRPVAACYLFDRHEHGARLAGALRDLYRLSPAESKVAAAFTTHPDLRRAAEQLFISPTTARTHLQRIFSKTNTRNRSSLLHRIMTGPGMLLRVHEDDKEYGS